MLHSNFARYIGQRLDQVQALIEDEFFGNVVIYTPGQEPDSDVKSTRLKIFVDEQDVINRIVNG